MYEPFVSDALKRAHPCARLGHPYPYGGKPRLYCGDELTDAGTHFSFECLCFIMQKFFRQEGVTMKDNVSRSKGRKVSRSVDTSLSKRMAELRRLREQVRLAEVAMRPRHNMSQLTQH
jgi:hypothetical protein